MPISCSQAKYGLVGPSARLGHLPLMYLNDCGSNSPNIHNILCQIHFNKSYPQTTKSKPSPACKKNIPQTNTLDKWTEAANTGHLMAKLQISHTSPAKRWGKATNLQEAGSSSGLVCRGWRELFADLFQTAASRTGDNLVTSRYLKTSYDWYEKCHIFIRRCRCVTFHLSVPLRLFKKKMISR